MSRKKRLVRWELIAAAEVFQNGSQRLFAGVWTPEEFIEQIVNATNASRAQ